MTKGLLRMRGLRVAAAIGLAVWVCGTTHAAGENPQEKPAEALYLKLGNVGLDPAQVYQVRGASLERSAVHITLEDGTIAFTQDVMGRITGAFFEGEGEVLLTPPSDVERRSMSLFTGMAILEEHFATAYFRFNDDAAAELRPDLRATDNQQEFVQRWGATAKNLANGDATRLLMTFSKMLPATGTSTSTSAEPIDPARSGERDRYLHARLQGTKLGVFDIYFDSEAAEQVEAGQPKASDEGGMFYDVWTSFSPDYVEPVKTTRDKSPGPEKERVHERRFEVRRYTITIEVEPPKNIHARARMQCDVRVGGARALLFELSRFLQIDSVTLDGKPVEFIHNPAVEGTQVSRRGNDLVAVILPEAARAGQKLDFEFQYGGEVLADAGNGLLYVGARGTWYPNRGVAMADFDLEFEYPQGWTLVATGKPTAGSSAEMAAKAAGLQTSRWVTERPIPVAGFNLGKYKVATTQAGDVTVETYATAEMERNFPSPPIQVVAPNPADPASPRRQVIVPTHPSPVQNEVTVGESAARAIHYYAERFGPYPYSHLALTQMPGPDSQGWPGLVFLSSYAFLDQPEREQLHYEPSRILLQEIIPAHETAHQWWGDLITWTSYRDQWFSEGLANYCALMMLQDKDPAGFRQVLEMYRKDMIQKNKSGVSPMDAGPVTLGARLTSSRFPEAYEAILYGRGTWLFHMLRTMLRDAALKDAAVQGGGRKAQSSGSPDEPFVRALRKVRQRYEGKAISTRELIEVFAEDLPPSLRYEGKSSLDWFLEGWVNGTSLPKLELKAVKFLAQGAGTVVTGTILQKEAPEDLVTSVPVYAVMPGKQMVLLGRVFADGEESSFRLSAPVGTRKIVLDPNETILTSPK
ncbi:MAG TPA: M1 family aminopeptidase [Candidatus Binatus sp.]|nr:M1 family aminopeptidase [Candidatus Binatus sp.]